MSLQITIPFRLTPDTEVLTGALPNPADHNLMVGWKGHIIFLICFFVLSLFYMYAVEFDWNQAWSADIVGSVWLTHALTYLSATASLHFF